MIYPTFYYTFHLFSLKHNTLKLIHGRKFQSPAIQITKNYDISFNPPLPNTTNLSSIKNMASV